MLCKNLRSKSLIRNLRSTDRMWPTEVISAGPQVSSNIFHRSSAFRVKDNVLSDLVNFARLAKCGTEYLSCIGTRAHCIGGKKSRIGSFIVTGVRKIRTGMLQRPPCFCSSKYVLILITASNAKERRILVSQNTTVYMC